MTIGIDDSRITDDTYAWRPWSDVGTYVDKSWDPKNTPHHSIVGLTGSGKSYLAIKGILNKCCQWDRVLIIDSKGDDELVSTTGKPVFEIPRNPWYTGMQREEKPKQYWYRLAVSDDMNKARAQVGKALARVYKDGNWVVYFDEIYDITAPRKPNLNLGPYVEQIYKKGRSRKISLIGSTQSPAWVPRVFYDQASYAWIGRIRDEQRQKRLLEIGGMTKKDLSIISSLQRRQWLLAADNGEYFARTKVV